MKNIEKIKDLQKDLDDFCRWNDAGGVLNTLLKSNDLDILYENGDLFDFALSEDNYVIIEILIKYFEKYQLNNYSIDTQEYKSLQNKLVETLKVAIDGYDDLSLNMKKALSAYIKFDSSQDNLSDNFINDVDVFVENDDIQLSGKIDTDTKDINNNSEII